MTEKLSISNEKLNQPIDKPEELLPSGEVKLLDAGDENLDKGHQAEEARKAIEEAPDSSDKTLLDKLNTPEEQTDSLPDSRAAISHDLGNLTKERLLLNIRRQVSPPNRALSHLIHNPFVSLTSEAMSKTLSRPSGMLGGGILALLGSVGYYVLTKRVGLRYNYTIFLILFVSGFILGIALELLVYFAFSSRRKRLKN